MIYPGGYKMICPICDNQGQIYAVDKLPTPSWYKCSKCNTKISASMMGYEIREEKEMKVTQISIKEVKKYYVYVTEEEGENGQGYGEKEFNSLEEVTQYLLSIEAIKPYCTMTINGGQNE